MADEKSVETAKPAAPGKSADAPGHVVVSTMSVRDYAAEKNLPRWQVAAVCALKGWTQDQPLAAADIAAALELATTGRI